MGGRAFLTCIPNASFPRMAPQTYEALKTLHLVQLQRLFRLVGVPREAPEKESHGDIDYVVCSSISRVGGEDLKTALGAECFIAENPTTNLAIRVVENGSTFYQVDVNECQDEEEWRRLMFFHSYGDLGMILGVVARNNGMSLGLHGLKIPAEGSMPPFLLSADFERIIAFYGLDLGVWEAGFVSQRAVFEWVATSRLFDAKTFKETARREHRREDRKMYQAFLQWVIEQKDNVGAQMGIDNVVEEAMVFFGVMGAYLEEEERVQRRRRVKAVLNGKLVTEWTGLQGVAVKAVMDVVRENMDEDTILQLTRERMKARVLDAAALIRG